MSLINKLTNYNFEGNLIELLLRFRGKMEVKKVVQFCTA